MVRIFNRNAALRVIGSSLLVLALPAPSSAEVTAKFNGNGSHLYLWGADGSGCVSFSLYAARGGNGVTNETWMYYSLYDSCTNTSIAYGSGRISDSALDVKNKRATLVFSPSASANFYTEGATGTISLTLEENGLSSHTTSGHSRVEYPGYVMKSHGTWSYRTATATGSILGFALGNASGSLGESRAKWIEIERTQR